MKVKLPSGTEFAVTPLDWEDAWDISQRVLSVIEALDVQLGGIDWANIKNEDVLAFKGPICQVLSSKVVFDAARDCFKKCTYGGLRIDNVTFNEPKARGDMLLAAFHALKENCAPFFRKSAFRFEGELEREGRRVKVDIKMERHRFVVCELAAAGIGAPGELMRTRADLVADAYDYLFFKNEYQRRQMEADREGR